MRQHLPAWQELTCDHTILQCVIGVKIEFKNNISPTCENIYPQQACINTANISAVRAEIQKLLHKGVIKPSIHEEGETISPIFVRPKKDGTYRLILNLKQLNEYVEYHHFKMDTLEAAIKLMKPGCYMASIDLKDAYYTVAVHFEPVRFLRIFQWWGRRRKGPIPPLPCNSNISNQLHLQDEIHCRNHSFFP